MRDQPPATAGGSDLGEGVSMYKERCRITTAIWATLLLAAGFALWHILPDSIRKAIEPTALAATFTVNTADDHNDGVCNAADCTLREAINAANEGDTISFNIPASGVHTIRSEEHTSELQSQSNLVCRL